MASSCSAACSVFAPGKRHPGVRLPRPSVDDVPRRSRRACEAARPSPRSRPERFSWRSSVFIDSGAAKEKDANGRPGAAVVGHDRYAMAVCQGAADSLSTQFHRDRPGAPLLPDQEPAKLLAALLALGVVRDLADHVKRWTQWTDFPRHAGDILQTVSTYSQAASLRSAGAIAY